MAYYLGMVHRQMLEYSKAREYLEEAVRLKPDYLEARRLLADTLIAMDKPDLALPHLQELEKAGYQPAQTAMMLGLVAAKQKRYREAVDYFQKAASDPALAQEAKLQMSLALAAQNRLREAQKALVETINLAPQSNTAGFAQRYAAVVEKRLEEFRPFYFNVYAGVDYDSNVTLQPGGAAAAQLISGKGDAAYSYGGYLEYNPFPEGPYGLIGSYAFFQNFHPRISTFDQVTHTVGLTPTYQFQNGRLWLPFTYNYTDVQSDKYYTAFVLSPTYLYLLNPKVGLELGGRLAREYYWTPISFPQDDRSGRNLGGSLGAYYFLENQPGFLQARFSYVHDFTGGTNWDNTTYRLYLSALYPVTPRLKLNPFVDMVLQPYNFRFFDVTADTYTSKRYDRILTCGLIATYAIYKGLEANLHYYFTRDASNRGLYDYRRHIVGFQLGYRY
jgi:Tfp pilus assembly protein PilF